MYIPLKKPSWRTTTKSPYPQNLWNFQAWEKARNTRFPDDKVPPNLLQTNDKSVVNAWLSRYVVETRNRDGSCYPLSTLYQLLGGILRHVRNKNATCPNFLDKRDLSFEQLHGTLDSLFRKLHEAGIGRKVKHTEVSQKKKKTSCGLLVWWEEIHQQHYKMPFFLHWKKVLPSWWWRTQKS